jgi:cellulose synthase/poly-beta-1,6-N-acetylglucosamine synthase-like glycosyltransferase
VARFGDPDVGAVSGDVRITSVVSELGFGEARYYSLERPIQLGESRVGSMIGVDGGMYVVRRELFQPLPPDTVLDDFATSMRVIRQGKRIVYEPAAIASENGTPSWRHEFRRRVRVKCGAIQALRRGLWPPLSRPIELWQYVSHKLIRWMGPLWLLALLVSATALWSTSAIYRTAFLAQIAFYGVAALAWIFPRFRRIRLAGLAFYFTMSHVAMGVGLVQGFFHNPSGVWERTPRTPILPTPRKSMATDCCHSSTDRLLAASFETVSATSGAH